MRPASGPILAWIDEAFDKRSWHGPNLRGALRGVAARQAAWRPAPGRHSIWELVLHAAYWKYVVRRRLTGEKRGSFAVRGSNWWECPAEPSEAAWRRDLGLLASEHQTLRQAIAAFLASAPSGERLEASLHLIRGVAAHDLYHAGQIQLLKRLYGNAGRAPYGKKPYNNDIGGEPT